ncbi:MAG: hypothetical protein JOY85_21375 [Acidobacteriaceae bacterium]|nr:hypothetical protein [Acidobacteriaceae bacterium]
MLQPAPALASDTSHNGNFFLIALVMAPPLHPVRTFLSPDSTLGFGISDYVEFVATLLLAALVLLWATAKLTTYRVRESSIGWLIFIAALPIALRLVLLPRYPPPVPSGADDFSYLLLADTLRHFRLANPAHPFPHFFEQVFVLQQPTYSSMYALGQGLVLALGWLIFGHPWAGVLLSVAALCGGCYWMLRAWTSPNWALAGGLLAVFEFGPLSYWTNCYWGGAVSATAGCLVFGALPRIRHCGRTRDAALLGLGLAVQLLTRPFEFCFLLLSVLVFFLPAFRLPADWKGIRRVVMAVCLFLFASGALMCLHNQRVTGSWTTLPYMLSQYQYGTPPTFTVQPNPVPHRKLNEEQELTYRAQSIIHGTDPETLASYAERLFFRLRFLRFFILPPLYIAILAFVGKLREFRFTWVLVTMVLFALGSNFFPYFYPHYVAALASLFVLMAITGLEKINSIQIAGGKLPILLGSLILLLCAVHFLFWFGVHAVGGERLLSTIGPFETWDYINYGDPQGRIAINQQLAKQPGKKLVFVHYAPGHQFQEWVHNEAEIDLAPVVWVHDLGPDENQQLLNHYPYRTAWLLEPDQVPPKLTPYSGVTTGFQDVH